MVPPFFFNFRISASLIFSLVTLGLGLSACVGPAPVEDFALARSAQESARDAEAVRYAPNLWYKAQEQYKKAQVSFDNRDYEEAKESFIETRQMFEKAETMSRISRMQAGGVPQ